MSKLIVCLAGMPGAGKSTIAAGLKEKGFEIINMGDAVRAEAKNRDLEINGQNLGKLMLDLREKNGAGAIANLIIPHINNSKSNIIVVDGIRSSAEIEVLKKCGIVKILSIHCSTNSRYDFLTKRGRADDPTNREKFNERDNRELSVGISTSIDMSDETISNDQLTIEQLIESAYKIIHEWTK